MKQMVIGGAVYTFKKATLKDIERITALYNQGNKTANADIHPVSVDNRIKWFNAHKDDRPIMGLYDDNRLIAWASLSDLYDRPAYHISTEISIYVDFLYQRLGLGGVLLAQMMVLAKDLGVVNIVALIYGDNQASLSLFAKAEFERWGVMPEICQIEGRYKDVVMMGVRL